MLSFSGGNLNKMNYCKMVIAASDQSPSTSKAQLIQYSRKSTKNLINVLPNTYKKLIVFMTLKSQLIFPKLVLKITELILTIALVFLIKTACLSTVIFPEKKFFFLIDYNIFR